MLCHLSWEDHRPNNSILFLQFSGNPKVFSQETPNGGGEITCRSREASAPGQAFAAGSGDVLPWQDGQYPYAVRLNAYFLWIRLIQGHCRIVEAVFSHRLSAGCIPPHTQMRRSWVMKPWHRALPNYRQPSLRGCQVLKDFSAFPVCFGSSSH